MSKKTDIWMSFYIGDYLADTLGLSKAEHGSYILTIFAYWRNKGPLSDQDFKRSVGTEFDTVSTFFEFDEITKIWRHKRIEEEIELAKKVQQSRSERGRRGAEAKWHKDEQAWHKHASAIKNDGTSIVQADLSNAQAMLGDAQSHSQSHTQQHSNLKNNMAVRPNFLSEKVWNDFLTLRKSKKSPLTKTALERIESEAKKAGWSLENALKECCSRGWQGFKADWVKSKNGVNHERSAEEIESVIDRNTKAIERHIAAKNNQQSSGIDLVCIPETLGQHDDIDAIDAALGEFERFE